MFKAAKDINENTPWQQLTVGAEIYEPGTSKLVKTGEWRTLRPVFDAEKCKQCLLCAPFCPDVSILVCDSKRGETDLDHCKGCGVCAKVCPFGAIEMVKEAK